jgi:alkanesulfonate monooxygenase SsuD/methylene tetrahydromethanopterin reductase-like flavin-dependent oxidoreductase (luciferase family)
VVAADNDAQADYLASSLYQRVHGIITGRRGKLPSPVEGFLQSLPSHELAAVQDFLAAAVIGGPETVHAGLMQLAELTQANEFIMVNDIYDTDLRLRSLDITAQVMRGEAAKQPGATALA